MSVDPASRGWNEHRHRHLVDDVTLTDVQTLTNKTLNSPHVTGPVVDSGGLTITAGGLTVTAGGATITAGGLTVTAGDGGLCDALHAHFGVGGFGCLVRWQ